MAKLSDSQEIETGGVLSSYQFLTLYFPAFVLSLGYSIATPAIPIFAKSFDTGFGVASLVIVVHALGGLIAAVPTGFLVDHLGRRPMLFAGPILMAAASVLTAVAQSFPELLFYRFLGGGAMEMWRQARLAIIADVSKSRQRGRQMSGMVGTEGAAKLLGPAVGGVLATWSIRTPFLVHGALAFLAIVPSFFLVQESAPVGNKDTAKKTKDRLDTRALLAMMFDAKYRGFFAAQFFASMTRGVLWGGTLLLYAAYAYEVGPQLLGGLATTTSIVGIPVTLSCGYLMDRFGRKTTMVPGFVCVAVGLMFLASSAQWHWSLASFITAVIWTHAGQSVTAGS
ncbi:MAG TPA: MFS transporter, partial [Candidatus Binatia bacterium]|nr:MFS transporter [Candidatus Binatia bacterium]